MGGRGFGPAFLSCYARGVPTSITKEFKAAIDHAVTRLEDTDDQVVRARLANLLIELARDDALEAFGEERTNAYMALREEFGWSLADLAREFGQSRARAAQIACRERYKSGESKGGGGNPRRGVTR
jgi:hypothetical protein